ncbi:MAG: nucleoside:proton symporter [Deltaproteobacteria bacterium]|nr:nucleoside:proton symporter [Deltaproteobacteria bacterium]
MAQSILGLAAFILIAWLCSENRRGFPWKVVAVGLVLQFLTAFLLLHLRICQTAFLWLNSAVLALEQATKTGTSVVFGYLGGGPLPFAEPFPGAAYILAFRGLPMVLLISALSSLLFYWRILPRIVDLFSRGLRKSFALGGAEGLGVAANIFVGMVEAPLFIRPYLEKMTRSELFTLMTSGMATIAGTVMVLYATILGDRIPNVMGHILTASLISAPAAILIAKVMIPEREAVTDGGLEPDPGVTGAMDAVTQGTVQGVQLLIQIVAMLVVMVALIELVNRMLGILPLGPEPLTLQKLAGWVCAPAAWLIGIPWPEAPTAGALLGVKTMVNEFVAYLQMARLGPGELSPKSLVVMSYALCGFANPGSLGIMIGGMAAMAPCRRREIVGLGLRSLLSGTLAACMTGAVASLLL